MTKYCILGGGGSFGLHTAKYLLEQPDTESVLSIGRGAPKARCFTLGVGEGDKRYQYQIAHVTQDISLLRKMLHTHKPEIIINFAAQGEGATSFTESWRYFETNCLGLSRLVEWLANQDWLRNFVHISTSELYGSTDQPADENAPLRPTSPYAISKAAFDQYLQSMHAYRNFPMTIIRPSNCYGPGQQLHRIIPKAVLYGLTEQKLPLHGGGLAEKSYIHSRDLAVAIHLVAQTEAVFGTGQLFNVGPKYPITIREVVTLVAGALYMKFDDLVVEVSDRVHQDSKYWLDSSKIRARFGWKPEIDWDQGLKEMVTWGRKYMPYLKHRPTTFVMRA